MVLLVSVAAAAAAAVVVEVEAAVGVLVMATLVEMATYVRRRRCLLQLQLQQQRGAQKELGTTLKFCNLHLARAMQSSCHHSALVSPPQLLPLPPPQLAVAAT